MLFNNAKLNNPISIFVILSLMFVAKTMVFIIKMFIFDSDD